MSRVFAKIGKRNQEDEGDKMSERMRIDKMLSHTGFGTRKEVKELIKSGVVSVNGKVVKKPKEQVDPEGDEIVVGLESIEYQKYYYFMLNKRIFHNVNILISKAAGFGLPLTTSQCSAKSALTSYVFFLNATL